MKNPNPFSLPAKVVVWTIACLLIQPGLAAEKNQGNPSYRPPPRIDRKGGDTKLVEVPPRRPLEKWAVSPGEGELAPFLRPRKLERKALFSGGRFPNVIVAADGTVVATWGNKKYSTRRSPDGGSTWEDEVLVSDSVIHGGGALVDEVTGDLLVFMENHHPPTEDRRLYRSRDAGKTWEREKAFVIHPIQRRKVGMIPNLHMDENGITLRHGPRPGRLIRTTGNFMGSTIPGGPPDAFVNAIFSDDGGKTWDTSAPFPAFGCNEAAVEELSDGRLLLIARRHLATDGLDHHWKHFAWSHDAGLTWRDLRVSQVLPDGNTNSRYGLMHGLVRLPIAGRDILIFSNVESDKGRERGTLWASFDGGETWPVKRLIEPGPFAYSSLAAGHPGTPSEGSIYLLYEHGPQGVLTRFSLHWLLQGQATGDGKVPGWVE
jgi:sialidase-1